MGEKGGLESIHGEALGGGGGGGGNPKKGKYLANICAVARKLKNSIFLLNQDSLN